MLLNNVNYDEYNFEQGLMLNIKKGVSDDIRSKCLDYWDFKINDKIK